MVFAVSGWRRGLVVALLSVAGFLGGGALGAVLAPRVAVRLPEQVPAAAIGVVVVVVLAVAGQALAGAVGGAVRDRFTRRAVRWTDSAVGAVASVGALLLVAWLLATAALTSAWSGLAREVRASRVLTTVEAVLPDAAATWFSSFRRLVDERGVPQVFAGIARPRTAPVPPPDPALAESAAVRTARSRVLEVTGVAAACSRGVSGSGFVYAPQRVMTNAHVVAGVTSPSVQVGSRELPATVVAFDPRRDLAVLRVPGLDLAPLGLELDPAAPGTGGVVAGFPGGGPFAVTAARVRAVQPATGSDIYQSATVTREVYTLRAAVRPGNSGGPLLAADGSVLGVVFAAAADDPDTGYAVTAREAAPVAEAGRTATGRVSTRGCA